MLSKDSLEPFVASMKIYEYLHTKENVCYKALDNKVRLGESLLVAVKMDVFVNNSKTV